MTRLALALLPLLLPTAAFAQPAPRPFSEIMRYWSEKEGSVEIKCMLRVDETSGVVQLSKLPMGQGPSPVSKEGRLTDPVLRERLQLAAAMVEGLADIQPIGVTTPTTSYVFMLPGAPKAQFFEVDPDANLGWKRVADAALNQLVTQLMSGASPIAFVSLQWIRDAAPNKVAGSVQVQGAGIAESHETLPGGTRIIRGEITPALRDAIDAALVTAALDTPIASETGAAHPRSRLRFTLGNGAAEREIVVREPTPARLAPLRAALDAVAAHLAIKNDLSKWSVSRGGGKPSSVEISSQYGVRQPQFDGWVKPIPPALLGKLTAALQGLDLAALDRSVLPSSTYFDVNIEGGVVARISRNRDASGKLISPTGVPEASLLTLDAVIDEIAAWSTSPGAPKPSYGTSASAQPAGAPRSGITQALGE